MESNIRTIKVNTGANTNSPVVSSFFEEDEENLSLVKNRRNAGRRRTRKTINGGAIGSPDIQDSMPAPKVDIGKPIINVTKIQSGGSTPNGSTASNTSRSNIPPEPKLSTTVTGGADETKVVLKRKNRSSKVLLKKRVGGVLVPTADTSTSNTSKTASGGNTKTVEGGAIAPKHMTKTRSARKLIVKNIGTKAKKTRHAVKKIIDHAKDLPIDKLKKHLIDKKLIKSNSKAPEMVLRQIYADSVIVGKKAL